MEINSEIKNQDGRLNTKELLKNAKLLLAAGDLNLSKRIFTVLIENGEALGKAYAGLGTALELEGKIELAIKAYREAIIYEPTYGSLSALADLLMKKGEYKNAIGSLLRACNLPELPAEGLFDLHKQLGNCYIHLEQLNNAEAHYRKAYEINPNSDVLHVNIGTLALKRNDGATALLHFKEASRINKANAGAWTGIGLAQMALDNKSHALEAFATALETDIREVTALYNLVRCAYELKQFDRARLIIQEYIKNNPVNSNILYSYAGILFHSGMQSEALEECEKLLSFSPEHSGALKIRQMIQGISARA
jgi:tetratricopeptide (TPR) repeat protein